MFDLHSHLIPGVDDGAATLAESRSAIAALRGQGVTTVVATPHVKGSITRDATQLARRFDALDDAWSALCQRGCTAEAGVSLLRGAEVMLDSPAVDLSDPRLRLGGSCVVLVEFAGFLVPPRSAELLGSIVEQGYRPILAHPERYPIRRREQVLEWRAAGVAMQINAGSLLGHYGERAKQTARRFLAEGWADCIASDYHARGEPALAECASDLSDAPEQAELLLTVNPRRLLDGCPPLEVAPVVPRKRMFWRRA